MKSRTSKKTSTVIITLAIAVILVTAVIITIIMLMNKPKQGQVGNAGGNGTSQVASTGNFHENGWDASIVAEIRDGDVPVPVGFQYVSGDKKTGLIVQNPENGKMYVWIPYSDTSMNDEEKQKVINEYFKDKDNAYINPDKLAEIQKYGGFYAGIDYIGATVIDPEEDKEAVDETKTYAVATMKQNEYDQANTQIAQENANATSVNGSVMGKEELSMILDYTQANTENSDKMKISTSLISEPITNLDQLQSASTDSTLSILSGRKFYVKTGGGSGYGTGIQLPAIRPTGAPLKVDALEQGAPVIILDAFQTQKVGYTILPGQEATYVRVRYYTGAEYNMYLTDLSATPVSATGTTFYMEGTVRYISKNTTMRTQPTASSGAVKDLVAGETVWMYKATVLTNNLWYYVRYGNNTWGYVPASDTDSKNIWTRIEGDQTRYVISGTGLYSAPETTNARKIKTLTLTTKVKAIRKATIGNDTWAYVEVGGKKGFVLANNLGTADPKTTLQASVPNGREWEDIGDTRYVVSGTSLYYEPAKRVVDRIALIGVEKGTSVYVMKKATKDGIAWAYASVNGRTGYIEANKLGVDNPNKPQNNGGNGGGSNKPTTPTNPTPTNTTPPTTNTNTTDPGTTTPEEPTEPEEPKTVPAYTGEVITVKPGENKIVETEVPDKWKNTIATIVNGVPVPKGFEVATYYGPADENTGFVIRQLSSKESENFHRLCYVWVPVNKNGNTIESLEDAKRALNEAYTKAGLNTKTSESATESLPAELVKSVKEYGGFYIAMGELGYDNNGKLYNRPRGMKESSSGSGMYGVDYGNYFRYVPESYWNQTSPVNYVAAAATYDNIMKDCTLERINKVCGMLSTESVTSHLTYGAEWDAAMLWILKRDASTSEDLTSLLLKDSSSIGKYSGTMFNAKMLNCTWGFAGNLAEVTQEKVDGKIVVRGGSYATLGSEQPVASRTAIEENEIRTGNQYGFRNCIYINLTEGALEPESELQALIDSGKTVTDRIATVTDKEGQKISIPQGFKVTKDAYHVNEGVVIENEKGDQFVWIPVADVNEMYNANEQSGKLYNITKNGSNLKVITSLNDKYFEPGIVTGGDGKSIDADANNLKTVNLDSASKLERQIKTEFNAMINSVRTYGGFYIARYETGNIDQDYPSVKQNAQNRTSLNWYEAYVKNQNIQTGAYGISGTIYGCQWDMAMRWLQSCDNSYKKVNHIEDLANGRAEWTMEAYANDARVARDATREETTVVQAGTRMDYNPTQVGTELGTRAMMYVR